MLTAGQFAPLEQGSSDSRSHSLARDICIPFLLRRPSEHADFNWKKTEKVPQKVGPLCKVLTLVKAQIRGSGLGPLENTRLVERFISLPNFLENPNTHPNKEDQAFWDLRFSTRKPPVQGAKFVKNVIVEPDSCSSGVEYKLISKSSSQGRYIFHLFWMKLLKIPSEHRYMLFQWAPICKISSVQLSELSIDSDMIFSKWFELSENSISGSPDTRCAPPKM